MRRGGVSESPFVQHIPLAFLSSESCLPFNFFSHLGPLQTLIEGCMPGCA